jgi:hypothetical protein
VSTGGGPSGWRRSGLLPFHAAGIALLALFWVQRGFVDPHLSADGAAYWGVRDGVLYEYGWLAETRGDPVPYVYSPAFAQLLWPLVQLELETFMVVWVAMQLVLLAWLVTPLPAAGFAWLVPAVGLTNVWAGAIYIPMAAALAISLRWPSAWAFQAITKVTPAIGAVWHVARGEWRAVGMAAGTTGLIFGVSFLASPSAWFDWMELLAEAAGAHGRPGTLAIPVVVRLPVAAVIVVVAARFDARWLLPFGVLLAMPQIGPSALVLLLAIPRLVWAGGWHHTLPTHGSSTPRPTAPG